MKYLITGGNGLIGSHIVEELLNDGEKVRVLIKPGTDESTIERYSRDIERVYGDIRDREFIDEAVGGCDGVYHLAASHLLWAKSPEIFYDVNVEGTYNVVEGAVRAGLKRIVYTSTCDIVGARQRAEGKLGDENGILVNPNGAFGHYGKSKILGEQIVKSFSNEIESVFVYPSCPIGRNNTLPTEPGRLIESIIKGDLRGYLGRSMNFVHVRDCAKGHVSAMNLGVKNECYILAGENITLEDFIGSISKSAGVQPPKLKVPYFVGLGFAHISEMFSNISGKMPQASVEGVRLVKSNFVFSSEKAKRELGYKITPLREIIDETVDWHRERINKNGVNL